MDRENKKYTLLILLHFTSLSFCYKTFKWNWKKLFDAMANIKIIKVQYTLKINVCDNITRMYLYQLNAFRTHRSHSCCLLLNSLLLFVLLLTKEIPKHQCVISTQKTHLFQLLLFRFWHSRNTQNSKGNPYFKIPIWNVCTLRVCKVKCNLQQIKI